MNGLTIASLAKLKFFKYYLKDSNIPLINTNTNILPALLPKYRRGFWGLNFLFSAYYGGITEVYIPYGQDLTFSDINLLYPAAA